MSSVTVSVSFQEGLAHDLERAAESESRSRAEVVRVAVRSYLDRKARWEEIFAFGREVARKRGIKPGDVEKEIAAYRKEKAALR